MSLTTVVSHTDPIILRDPDPDGWHELHFGARCLRQEASRLVEVVTKSEPGSRSTREPLPSGSTAPLPGGPGLTPRGGS